MVKKAQIPKKKYVRTRQSKMDKRLETPPQFIPRPRPAVMARPLPEPTYTHLNELQMEKIPVSTVKPKIRGAAKNLAHKAAVLGTTALIGAYAPALLPLAAPAGALAGEVASYGTEKFGDWTGAYGMIPVTHPARSPYNRMDSNPALMPNPLQLNSNETRLPYPITKPVHASLPKFPVEMGLPLEPKFIMLNDASYR
jgi:hypothetical protein